MQSPIANYCLTVSIDGHPEPQVFPKLLLRVSFQELHNSMLSPPEDGGLQEAIYADNNIIISYSTLQSILQPQLNKMSVWHKVVCGFECSVSAKSIHSSSLSWCDSYLRDLNGLSQNAQNRRSGEKYNRLFDTYKTMWCHIGVIYMQQQLT